MLPQTAEPDADSRLALSKLLRDARDAANVVQKIEKLQQFQIGEFCRVHGDIVWRNDLIVSIALPV
jgi:hypothetical protein